MNSSTFNETFPDLDCIRLGQAPFPNQPLLSPKYITESELRLILNNDDSIHSPSFIFKRKQLFFRFPNNNAINWKKDVIKVLTSLNSDSIPTKMPLLYKLCQEGKSTFKGEIFIRTKAINNFTENELQNISRTILKNFILVPQKFCSIPIDLAISSQFEIVPVQKTDLMGKGYFIYFNVEGSLKKTLLHNPLSYYAEARFFYIGSRWSHNRDLTRLICDLIVHGNKISYIFYKQIAFITTDQIFLHITPNYYNFAQNILARRINQFSKNSSLDYIENSDLNPYIHNVKEKETFRINHQTYQIVEPSNLHQAQYLFHSKYGFGTILKFFTEKESERIEVDFRNSLKRTFIIKYMLRSPLEFYFLRNK